MKIRLRVLQEKNLLPLMLLLLMQSLLYGYEYIILYTITSPALRLLSRCPHGHDRGRNAPATTAGTAAELV